MSKIKVAKNQTEKKVYTKKQVIIFSVAVAIALILIVTAIAVPLAIFYPINQSNINPEVVGFDQKNDIYVKVEWKKIKKATSYSVQYVYGNVVTNEKEIVSAKTNGDFYLISRQKGVLAYRVRYNTNDRNGDYCEWKYFNVEPIKMASTSNIILDDYGNLNWKKMKYLYYEKLEDVPSYLMEMTLSGELIGDSFTLSKNYLSTNTLNIKEYLIPTINYDGVEQWSDVTLTIKVKCLNCFYIGNQKVIDGFEFLYNAYDESDYFEQIIIIDKKRYEDIKGQK